MKQAKNADELAALPHWVVIRTSSGLVRERNRFGRWMEIGTNEDGLTWEDEDFPVTVLWSYAEEVYPPLPLSPPSGIYPYPIGGGGTVTAGKGVSHQ